MKRWQIALVVVLLLLASAAAFFFMPAGLEPAQASPSQPTGAALIEKGRYLATAGDCAACHSVPGGAPLAGGLAFKLPFGTIYSSNITPDRDTGIGSWSDAEFVRAMHHGVRKDGQELYPAFPYTAYTRMSTDDALAIRAYLATVPAARSKVQPNALSFPFNQRWLMRAWKRLFMPKGRIEPDPGHTPEWNRGAYLVEGFAHCGECHTPRNLLYGLREGRKFAGATTQGWTAYNISSDPRAGIGAWSVDEIAAYLSTGHAAGRGSASGSMAEAIELSLSHLSGPDIRAMAIYLKSIPPQAARHGQVVEMNPPALLRSTAFAPGPGVAKPGDLGMRIFEGSCASCHGWNGDGLQTPYATLRGAQSVNDPRGTNVIQVVLRGSKLTLPGGTVFMPGFGRAYTDAEIAAVTNFVLAQFGNKPAGVTPKRVAEARQMGG